MKIGSIRITIISQCGIMSVCLFVRQSALRLQSYLCYIPGTVSMTMIRGKSLISTHLD